MNPLSRQFVGLAHYSVVHTQRSPKVPLAAVNLPLFIGPQAG